MTILCSLVKDLVHMVIEGAAGVSRQAAMPASGNSRLLSCEQE